MVAENKIRVFAEIKDEAGANRLVLRFIEHQPSLLFAPPGVPVTDERTFYDFHSLAWDASDGVTWKRTATITRKDLQIDGTRRWICDIHAFDADAGSAIIKMGEGDWDVKYSWRQWDLFWNKEIRLLKTCMHPFDPL